MGQELIGGPASPRVSPAILALLAAALALIVLAIVVRASREAPGPVAGRPSGVPGVERDGIRLACPEFWLAERRLVITLDFAVQDFQGSWYALENECTISVAYGGGDHVALVRQVSPLQLPGAVQTQRLVLAAHFDRDQPPPAPGASITASLTIPGSFFRRAQELTFTIPGIESVTR